MSRMKRFDWAARLIGHARRRRSKSIERHHHRRRLAAEPLEDRRMLAVITVDSLLDNTTDDGLVTLREAIIAANTDALADATEGTQAGSGDDTIEFDTALDGGVIELDIALGELAITDAVTIDATALAGGLSIDASTADSTPDIDQGDGIRIFNIGDDDHDMNFDVTIAGLTLTGGDVSGGGGAIYSRENLIVSASTITGNHMLGPGLNPSRILGGGGISAWGAVTLNQSTVSGNSTSGPNASGGGIDAT